MSSRNPDGDLSTGRVARRPIHRQVQDAIKDYILTNRLSPGDPLPSEGQLAGHFGVSRNSVREGVKALEVQGVIEARVGSGLFVRSFSFDPILDGLPYGMLVDLETVGHLVHLREVLDLGAAPQIVSSVGKRQLDELRSVLDEWRLSAEVGDYPAELDRRFHDVLYAELGNPLLQKLNSLFWDVSRQLMDQGTARDLPDTRAPKQIQELHEAIYDAILDANLERLRVAISAHYPGIWSALA